MSRSTVLLIDALVSLVLGVFLLALPEPRFVSLGLPPTKTTFYARILGAVVVGVAVALLIEWRRKPKGFVGLGLGGAIGIDLCAAVVLAGWLLFGGLDVPLRGRLLLWLVVVVLVVVSGLGYVAHRKPTRG